MISIGWALLWLCGKALDRAYSLYYLKWVHPRNRRALRERAARYSMWQSYAKTIGYKEPEPTVEATLAAIRRIMREDS